MIRWWQFRKRAACPHSKLRPIHGDEIVAAGYKRLDCLDCRRLLDGPVVIAYLRKNEPRLVARHLAGIAESEPQGSSILQERPATAGESSNDK